MYKATSFIAGNPIFSEKEIEIFSPIDGQLVGTIPSLSENQILEAFEISREAFGKWRQVDYKTRSKYLLEFAAKLREHAPVLEKITHLEIGKSIESVHAEIMRSADYIVESVHAYSDMMEKPDEYSYENNVLVPKGINATYIRVPHGVVLTISPFNYPINLMITKIVPAILAGNVIVHKSATHGSLTGWYIAKIFNDLSVDGYLITPGVLNYVTGSGSELGNFFIKSKNIDAFSFTGSTYTGKKLSNMLPLMPLQLEMGGHNAAVIFEDANLDLCVSEVIKGAFSFSGQRCTALKRIFVNKKIQDPFIKLLKQKIKEVKLTEPLISDSIVNQMKEWCDEALVKGAELISAPLEINGKFVTPMAFLSSNGDMKIFNDELFAPILAIMPFEKNQEALNLCNNSKYGLQASLFTSDIDVATKFALDLEVGRININKAPARSPDILPFSGIKDSGFEEQGIISSLMFFTRSQGIVLYNKAKNV